MRFFTSPTSSPLNSPMKSSSSSPLKQRKPSPLRSKSSLTKSLTKSPTSSPTTSPTTSPRSSILKRRCRDEALYIALGALDKDPMHGANAGISRQVQNESNKRRKTYGCRGCTDYKITLKKKGERITLLPLRAASKAIAIANVEERRKKRVFF